MRKRDDLAAGGAVSGRNSLKEIDLEKHWEPRFSVAPV
jgi:hypothetical protein